MTVCFFKFLHKQCIHSVVKSTLAVWEATPRQQPVKTPRDVGTAVLHHKSCGGLREAVLDTRHRGLLIANVDDTRTADTGPECRTDRFLNTECNSSL